MYLEQHCQDYRRTLRIQARITFSAFWFSTNVCPYLPKLFFLHSLPHSIICRLPDCQKRREKRWNWQWLKPRYLHRVIHWQSKSFIQFCIDFRLHVCKWKYANGCTSTGFNLLCVPCFFPPNVVVEHQSFPCRVNWASRGTSSGPFSLKSFFLLFLCALFGYTPVRLRSSETVPMNRTALDIYSRRWLSMSETRFSQGQSLHPNSFIKDSDKLKIAAKVLLQSS